MKSNIESIPYHAIAELELRLFANLNPETLLTVFEIK